MSDAIGRFTVVVVEFPFVERKGERRRPALVLTDGKRNRQTGTAVIAMITREAASPWPGDVVITHLAEAGLTKPCKVRMKLHTIQTDSVRPVGMLHDMDRAAVLKSLRECLAL